MCLLEVGLGGLLRVSGKAALILILRPATAADAEYLAPRLRPDDVREIEAASGRTPLEALKLAVGISDEAYTFRVSPHAAPFCIFGVARDPRQYGSVWFLGTPEVGSHGIELMREAPFWLERWANKYYHLHNLVDPRNTLAVRWVRKLGFDCEHVTASGRPFIHITLTYHHFQRSRHV